MSWKNVFAKSWVNIKFLLCLPEGKDSFYKLFYLFVLGFESKSSVVKWRMKQKRFFLKKKKNKLTFDDFSSTKTSSSFYNNPEKKAGSLHSRFEREK